MEIEKMINLRIWMVFLLLFPGPIQVASADDPPASPMVDTGQDRCFDLSASIACPQPGSPFGGQDAQYRGNPPAYRDNRDGTVTDRVTGLTWSKAVDETKVSLAEAGKIAAGMTLGGHSDWRVPNIKELYTLIDFRGNTGSHGRLDYGSVPQDAIPFINTDYFDFRYGNVNAGERYIDAQWLSGTMYVSTTMDGAETLFGVNFADGRIKGYGFRIPGRDHREKKFYARYVRGPQYGRNVFQDNGDGTVTDRATGLMWMRADSGSAMNWPDALQYAEDAGFAGHDDWRLPNAKELQFIVDYSRSPDTTASAAIDPVFKTTAIVNEAGQRDFAFYWTSTTHLEGTRADKAAYISFGRAIGQMHGETMDVHGAGAQRSDPKTGRAQLGMGPQGDARRVLNYVRLVRGGGVRPGIPASSRDRDAYPIRIRVGTDFSRSVSSAGRRPSLPPPAGMPGYEGRRMPAGGAVENRFIGRLDRDGDGRVSPAEFDGPADQFQRFDRNGDGYISAAEAPTGPQRGRRGSGD